MIKISQPMFEVGELERFDNNIHSIVEEYSKLLFKEKDQILTQRIIMKQEEEIIQLQDQLQQKENIIKEVREWAKKYSCQFTNDDGELVVSEISFNIQARPCDLFKILDKENR